ncbi:BON domain-containing protein [Chitinophaga sancti]|uniref:BON domain-containing protein n=1 Tax=Chitinophaga sancti TaxID=1004 RepID=UPI002A759468|nr:BON domain-containing protein [Chitinophaga sancti]WPQ60437.1 BON domain-containing protein [Chitinophaga sancti]
MRSDYILQQNVLDEFLWEPSLEAAEIGVSVKNGIVTLSGTVDSISKKNSAERAVKRIKDVKAVAMAIEVVYPSNSRKTDAEIAKAALDALAWNSLVPKDHIRIEVENGYITLEGEVEWQYQRNAAKDVVKDLQGVKGIANLIVVKPIPSSFLVKNNILNALHRMANIDAHNIQVLTLDNTIILNGTVRSWRELEQVEHVVWSTPGVSAVINDLEVAYYETVTIR